MGFSFLGGGGTPIAIDFGSASTKLLQIREDERPRLAAAAELPMPDSARGDTEREFEYLQEFLPQVMSRGKFKGRRAVISIPGGKTLIQHLSLPRSEGISDEEIIKSQLSTEYGCSGDAIITRHSEVCEVHRSGSAQREMIVVAIPRSLVMRYVGLLRRARIEVVGVHAAPHAVVHAYAHLNRRPEDREVTTCYVNLGWSGTVVTIAHGPDLVFARQIDVGGKQLDEQIASTLRCDVTAARTHRLEIGDQARKTASGAPAAGVSAVLGVASSMAGGAGGSGSGSGGFAPGVGASDRRGSGTPEPGMGEKVGQPVDSARLDELNISELIDVLADELSMSMRYHKGLFPERSIDRVIFLGGESRQMWLCRHLTNELSLPAQLGDPMTRYAVEDGLETPGLDLGQPQPGWSVACGLCNAPTDL